jgi:hypothetical protein
MTPIRHFKHALSCCLSRNICSTSTLAEPQPRLVARSFTFSWAEHRKQNRVPGQFEMTRAWFTALILGLCITAPTQISVAHDGLSYPSSPLITAEPLDQTRRELLHSVINAPRGKPVKPKVLEQLCPFTLIESTAREDAARESLTVVENSVATEVLFERVEGTGERAPQRFSFLVEFSLGRVLLQHSDPRFSSDAGGLSAPYPSDTSRALWSEGGLGTDMFVLIPPLKACNVQAVVLCPRSYQHPNKLVDSEFRPVAARFIVTAKADGLYTNPAGTTAQVMASLQGSKNVALPREWSATTVADKDPAATVRLETPRGDRSQYPSFIPMELPTVAAIRSRLDFGRRDAVLRMAFKETDIEISSFEVSALPSIQSSNSVFNVHRGACYLVTQWGTSQL